MTDCRKIQHIMIDKGFKQCDLAKESGLERTHINKILKKDVDVRESTLRKLCKALDCKVEDIW